MSNVEFDFDGAEDIAFWVSEDDTFENNIRIMFEDLDRLKAFLRENFPGLYEDEIEYGWAGDAQVGTFYDTREEAEEFMGEPKRFRRSKAGTWTAVEGAD